MIEELKEKLHEGGYTLAVAKNQDVRFFTGRGISDIYNLYMGDAEFLCGSTIVDKIIGKGAATVMILAQAKEVYTDVISENALDFFKRYDVKVSYGELVPHIIRRDGKGWCPVELLCRDIGTVEESINAITQFLNSKK
ncbi:MAG: DUF1893 domain-containing protein [Rikenellaceae bacterium]